MRLAPPAAPRRQTGGPCGVRPISAACIISGTGNQGWPCLLAVGPKQWWLLEESNTQGLAVPRQHFFLGHLGRSPASSLGEQCNAYQLGLLTDVAFFQKSLLCTFSNINISRANNLVAPTCLSPASQPPASSPLVFIFPSSFAYAAAFLS